MKKQALAVCCAMNFLAATALAQVGTAFTYQGELIDGGAPVEATCDFEFTLWDDPAAGLPVGPVVPLQVEVVAGRFTALLDFGVGALESMPPSHGLASLGGEI
jgi:hypothetical protein